MKTTKYYQVGSGASANVVRVRYDEGTPIEFTYFNIRTREWEHHPSAVDKVIMGDAEEISSLEAQVITSIRSAELEPERPKETQSTVTRGKGKNSTDLDLPTVTLEDDGEEDTAKNYHVSETPGCLYPYIVDADDYQSDTPYWLRAKKAGLTSEEVYERIVRLKGFRNLKAEKGLDLSKIDPEVLGKAKIWIDEDGNYHPENLE